MKPLPNIIKFDGLGTHWECEILNEISADKLVLIEKVLISELNRFTGCYSRFDKASLIGGAEFAIKNCKPAKRDGWYVSVCA